MSETFTKDGKTFALIMKGGQIERKINDYKYDHPGREYVVKDPDARGFFYLYGSVIEV
jgi:hypothetical protein